MSTENTVFSEFLFSCLFPVQTVFTAKSADPPTKGEFTSVKYVLIRMLKIQNVHRFTAVLFQSEFVWHKCPSFDNQFRLFFR